MPKVDLTGKKFFKLTALYPTGEVYPHGKNAIWMCKCDCGNYTTANSGQLRCGTKKSCGCAVIDHTGNLNKTHGGRNERLYLVWMDMRRRCYDTKDKNYHRYGGRGISVCDEWKDYAVFREWANSNGYDKDAKPGECTIDRIDVNGDYCPDNCRWIDIITQQNNRRSNVFITYNGKTQTATQWSREQGYHPSLINRRLSMGWSAERAITTPPRGTRKQAL